MPDLGCRVGVQSPGSHISSLQPWQQPPCGHDALKGGRGRYCTTLHLLAPAQEGWGRGGVATPSQGKRPDNHCTVQEAGPGRVRKISPLTGVQTPHHPVHTKSLHQLRYSGRQNYMQHTFYILDRSSCYVIHTHTMLSRD